ncbi:hypothetical protein [Candidatus Palauibacter sp.]|uniref:hypothetical protein n=1 Tax=Candidatus Palauibacter sp. TaxID=3101350 RepID=UPI003C6F8E4D
MKGSTTGFAAAAPLALVSCLLSPRPQLAQVHEHGAQAHEHEAATPETGQVG